MNPQEEHIAKQKPKVDDETTAEAFLQYAQEYHLAATTLVSIQHKVESALYFLYTHSIELCLKAYLRSLPDRLPTPLIHALDVLLKECQSKGLRLQSNIQNVIDLLESENKRQGYRYFTFVGTGRPEISYLREVADELIHVVSEEVIKRPTPDIPYKAVFKFTASKPEKK